MARVRARTRARYMGLVRVHPLREHSEKFSGHTRHRDDPYLEGMILTWKG